MDGRVGVRRGRARGRSEVGVEQEGVVYSDVIPIFYSCKGRSVSHCADLRMS
jgi:hypothetical protein